MDANWVKLIGHLVWPTTIVFVVCYFYGPLSKLVDVFSRRIKTFSAFKVKVELGALSRARALSTTVEKLRSVVVPESGLAPIVAGVIKTGSADFLTVELGADGDENWLTSRLFLLSAVLERSRAARCVVFLGAGQRFIGAARAREIRNALGARYLPYETAFAEAYGALAHFDPNIFRGGLSETLVESLASNFLRQPRISRTHPQGGQEIGWVKIDREPPRQTTWEFADWVTPGLLHEVLGQHLMSGSVVASVGLASYEATKSIVAQAGSYVALVTKTGVFQDLCDRDAVMESIAKEAMEQAADADESVPTGKRTRASAL